jgi:hypothetical protein
MMGPLGGSLGVFLLVGGGWWLGVGKSCWLLAIGCWLKKTDVSAHRFDGLPASPIQDYIIISRLELREKLLAFGYLSGWGIVVRGWTKKSV